MPKKLDATYRVVTPMFCGGADPERAELRLPSFKGVLRYWWRALAWAEYKGRLDRIRKRESELFGSAGGGQSLVVMRLDVVAGGLERVGKDEVLRVPGTNRPLGPGARYLGYGLMEAFPSRKKGTKAAQLWRECLQAPFRFAVRMRIREPQGGGDDLRSADFDLLRDALIAVGTVGGMGAKGRKGYGSLVLRSLKVDGRPCWDSPRTAKDLRSRLQQLQSSGPNHALPPYTAFSGQARIVLVSSRLDGPLALLDLLGRELVRYRSWGRNGKILGSVESERNFRVDHDLMKDVRFGRPARRHPCRVAFGLPHNYGGPKGQVAPADRDLDRRASPLFIHIHECGDRPVGVLSFLPALFLPKGKSKIKVGGTPVAQAPAVELYRPIHEFLDRLLDPVQRKESDIGSVIEVKL